MLILCVEQKNEEAKGSAVGEETSSLDTIVSEGALAASDVPAAMDASDAESDSGTHKPGLCFGRRRASKAAQKAASGITPKGSASKILAATKQPSKSSHNSLNVARSYATE